MNKEDVEQYIKTLEINPGSKYLIFINSEGSLRDADLCELTKLFAGITFVKVMGNPNELIKEVDIHD